MPNPTQKHPNPVEIVQASEKFLQWKPAELSLRDLEESHIEESHLAMDERHFTPAELAELWGVSVQTIRELFKDEDGVLKLGSDGTRNRRAYKTLRIPHSVAERVHTRLSC
jgi:hypothetical protein